MQNIGFDDIDHKLTWTAIADALEAGHRFEKAQVGDLLLRDGDRALLNRGAWIKGLGLALKSMSVFPENNDRTPPMPSIQGAMLLFDGETGAVKAVLDGVLVTKWKTAGDSVLGARLLARPDSRRLLVVGAGTVARSLMSAYREIFPGLGGVTIWNRNREKADALARELADEGLTIEVATDLSEAAASADIISCATMTKTPILKGEWIRPGTHVDLIGAYRPDMREADDELMRKAEVFVDSRETTMEDIGELAIPLAAGVITEGDVRGDFYDLCNGGKGRSGQDAITLFKNGGGAHLDLMTGSVIYEKFNAA
ncbi:ornithine cyclodeaminase family protein [Denitrobaculum tricleocarpae]|uniref:Ornithine cyclodeaminase n=1 Tax=Denitrobaculum tricleocarpae TaxID=2591009 RepID=A0A545U1S7_9PROT|nr:ornithine cyclodeaminase [Denitrobaculum tricleocarpae]TQV83406.1 ornithine cyclodeaminase [Denitrobaculum tricleocarpae]